MGNKASHSESEQDAQPAGGAANRRLHNNDATAGEVGDGDDVVEVPPPMQPISSTPLSTALGAAAEGAPESSTNHVGGDPLANHSDKVGGANCDDAAAAAAAAPPPPETDPDALEKILTQRRYRLQELLESEQTYVQDLEQCVEYIKFMRTSKEAEEPELAMPEDLKEGKDRMIFGNIEAIHEWHRE